MKIMLAITAMILSCMTCLAETRIIGVQVTTLTNGTIQVAIYSRLTFVEGRKPDFIFDDIRKRIEQSATPLSRDQPTVLEDKIMK